MTKFQIEIGAHAQADLTDIVCYISQTLHERQTAKALYQLLKREINSLEHMPERCPFEDDPRLRSLEIRKMLVKKYKILYSVDTTHRLVQIVRIVYAGRDIARLLDEAEPNDL